jgi:hypothetical protein
VSAVSPLRVVLPADGWKARPYQRRFWRAMETGTLRADCCWHRRSGKGQCAVNLCAVKSAERVGLYIHILPTMKQARKVIWEGLDNDGRPFMHAFPGFDDPGPGKWVTRKRDDEMKVWFANGSQYQVGGADEPDVAWRGANPVGVVLDEYSTTPKMRTLHDNVFRPILAANGGWLVCIYTPRGKNHAHRLHELARVDPEWFSEVLTVEQTLYEEDGVLRRVVSEEDIEKERRAGMSEALIRQEFFCDFTGPLESSYYGDAMAKADEEGRIGEVPWDSRFPVVTGWDLGIMDYTAIWFLQEVRGFFHWIDYYEGRGMPFEHYLAHVLGKPYAYSDHIAPHDFKHRDLSSGHSLYEISRDNWKMHFRVAPKLLVKDGIAAVRAMLAKSKFDETRCARGIQALREYRRQRDEANDDYLEQPVHDWASHGADAARTIATGRRTTTWQGGERLLQRLPIV